VARQVAIRRQRFGVDDIDFVAIQQAKNRNGIVILRPFTA
jgi:hypothetical protein